MISSDADAKFPTALEFLEQLETAEESCSRTTVTFTRQSGKKLPISVKGLGSLLSLLYRAACCAWGCKEGDHQIEWLAGRVINQAMSSYRLIRAAYYDEALMLVRGIGEIANLLWLFDADVKEMATWKAASRKDRLNNFSPAAVRRKVEAHIGRAPLIDEKRYQRLCEVGTHPMPGFAPGHYSGTDRPVLGVMLQPVGVYVCFTELCYAVAVCARPLARLLNLEEERKKQIVMEAINLIGSLGTFTVLNYEEVLEEILKKNRGDGAIL